MKRKSVVNKSTAENIKKVMNQGGSTSNKAKSEFDECPPFTEKEWKAIVQAGCGANGLGTVPRLEQNANLDAEVFRTLALSIWRTNGQRSGRTPSNLSASRNWLGAVASRLRQSVTQVCGWRRIWARHWASIPTTRTLCTGCSRCYFPDPEEKYSAEYIGAYIEGATVVRRTLKAKSNCALRESA